MITKTTILDHSKVLLDRCLETLQKGQAEYASGSDNGLQNFERIGAELGISRDMVLMVFARKHWDGVIAYVNGHKSQREGVEGRIEDLIVYLCLLATMVEEDQHSEESKIVEHFNQVSLKESLEAGGWQSV